MIGGLPVRKIDFVAKLGILVDNDLEFGMLFIIKVAILFLYFYFIGLIFSVGVWLKGKNHFLTPTDKIKTI